MDLPVGIHLRLGLILCLCCRDRVSNCRLISRLRAIGYSLQQGCRRAAMYDCSLMYSEVRPAVSLASYGLVVRTFHTVFFLPGTRLLCPPPCVSSHVPFLSF